MFTNHDAFGQQSSVSDQEIHQRKLSFFDKARNSTTTMVKESLPQVIIDRSVDSVKRRIGLSAADSVSPQPTSFSEIVKTSTDAVLGRQVNQRSFEPRFHELSNREGGF